VSEADRIGNKISDATFQAIREVLQKKENLADLAMESIIGGVERARIEKFNSPAFKRDRTYFRSH